MPHKNSESNKNHNKPAQSSPEIFPGKGEINSAVKKSKNKDEREEAKSSLKKDVIAGLTVSLNDAPDGLACGLLVGVNPIMGLYASIFGPIVGGLLNGSKLMIVSTTSSAAFVLGAINYRLPRRTTS